MNEIAPATTQDLLAALQEVEKRAERVSDQHVVSTYVDSGALVNALATRDNGIISVAAALARHTH